VEAHVEPRRGGSSGSRCRKPTLEDRLIARLLARWLDRELALGIGASLSEAHAARAEQLTGERTRRALARSLEKLVDHAEHPRSALLVAPCREQVRDAMPLIRSIAARLRSREPVDPRGVASLKKLLSDRSGPCYLRRGPDALTLALHDILESLDGEPAVRR
jgi:hypothetical protein